MHYLYEFIRKFLSLFFFLIEICLCVLLCPVLQIERDCYSYRWIHLSNKFDETGRPIKLILISYGSIISNSRSEKQQQKTKTKQNKNQPFRNEGQIFFTRFLDWKTMLHWDMECKKKMLNSFIVCHIIESGTDKHFLTCNSDFDGGTKSVFKKKSEVVDASKGNNNRKICDQFSVQSCFS